MERQKEKLKSIYKDEIDISIHSIFEIYGTILIKDTLQKINVTSNIGGYNSGSTISTHTSFDTILSTLFTPYVPPIINSLELKNNNTPVPQSVYAIGDIVQFTKVTISSTLDSSGSIMTSPTLTINGSSNSDTTFSIVGLNNTLQTIIIPTQTFTKDSVGSVQISITASNTNIIPKILNIL